MNLIFSHNILFSSSILFILFVIISINFILMSSIKKESERKLEEINFEIEKESFSSIKAEDLSKNAIRLEKKLDYKLLRIKLEILNIDFTLKEICKFINI